MAARDEGGGGLERGAGGDADAVAAFARAERAAGVAHHHLLQCRAGARAVDREGEVEVVCEGGAGERGGRAVGELEAAACCAVASTGTGGGDKEVFSGERGGGAGRGNGDLAIVEQGGLAQYHAGAAAEVDGAAEEAVGEPLDGGSDEEPAGGDVGAGAVEREGDVAVAEQREVRGRYGGAICERDGPSEGAGFGSAGALDAELCERDGLCAVDQEADGSGADNGEGSEGVGGIGARGGCHAGPLARDGEVGEGDGCAGGDVDDAGAVGGLVGGEGGTGGTGADERDAAVESDGRVVGAERERDEAGLGGTDGCRAERTGALAGAGAVCCSVCGGVDDGACEGRRVGSEGSLIGPPISCSGAGGSERLAGCGTQAGEGAGGAVGGERRGLAAVELRQPFGRVFSAGAVGQGRHRGPPCRAVPVGEVGLAGAGGRREAGAFKDAAARAVARAAAAGLRGAEAGAAGDPAGGAAGAFAGAAVGAFTGAVTGAAAFRDIASLFWAGTADSEERHNQRTDGAQPAAVSAPHSVLQSAS